jgi:hypothetical protein
MKLINNITDEQIKRLEPLYPKWVQFKNEKTLRLVPDQVAIMGQVWSEVMNKRWSGGCQACTVNAFSQVMSLYDAELDRRFKAQHESIQEPIKQTTDATTKKRTRRIQK